MAKVKIKGKLPEGYKLVNGTIVRSLKKGGATKKTLQPISRETANLEAEKGETALTDLDNDGSFELYNIGGKRHTDGGTPLNLPEQTFVYSDTRKMMFTVEELKELGIESTKKMTPAKASKKFPLNKYIDILQDEHSDEIAIRSAEEMLNKNKLKLSQIAFMQEKKKDFSDGLPVASYPYLMSQGINPQELEAQIQQQNNPQQGQMTQDQMAMGPGMEQLQQFTGPPQGGPPMGPPQGGMPPMGPPPGPGGPGGEGMPPMAQGGKEIRFIDCPPQIARIKERECMEVGMMFDRNTCDCIKERRPNPDGLPGGTSIGQMIKCPPEEAMRKKNECREIGMVFDFDTCDCIPIPNPSNEQIGNTTATQMLEPMFPMETGPVLHPRTLFGNIGVRLGNLFRPDHRDINPTHTRIDPVTRENIKTYKNPHNWEIGSGPSPELRPEKTQIDELNDGKETKKQRKKRIKNYEHPYLNEYIQAFNNAGISDETAIKDILSSMNITPADSAFVNIGWDRNDVISESGFDINNYIGNILQGPNWNISPQDKVPFYTSEPDEDGVSWDFMRNFYRNDNDNVTGVTKVKKLPNKKYGGKPGAGGQVGACSVCGKTGKAKMSCPCKYKTGGSLRSFVYGDDLTKVQGGKEHFIAEEGGRGIGVCGELEKIKGRLLLELKQAEVEGEAMDVIRGLHTKLQQVDRDMHDCMVRLMTDERNRRLHEKRKSMTVPTLEPITPNLKKGGCTSCQKNLRSFVYGGDIAQDGMEMLTPPDRMTEEELMLQQLANYRMELMRQYQVTRDKVEDPDFVADKETQEKLAVTFSTLEMKLDQVDQKAMELQNLIISRNQQIPLFPNIDNTTAQEPPVSPGEGYYRFGGDTLSKFVYGGSLPQYQRGKESKKIDLKNAGYAKYIGNTGPYSDLDHNELMKLVDDGVLKRESVSGSFYHANVCSDVNGNPVEGDDAESCKANGGYWVPGKRDKIKTRTTGADGQPISQERVKGRQAGNTAIDILNNPSYGPVIDKIFNDYVNNSKNVKRQSKSNGRVTNEDNWVDIDQFGGKDGMMNAFFSVNNYLNEAAAAGLGFCGQLGKDGKKHPQKFTNKNGKVMSISDCKSIECCKNIDRDNQNTLGVSIDEESARVFQGVYYSMDKLVNHDKDPDVQKLFQQIKVNPIGLKRAKNSKHFGADGKSPVSLVDGVIGGTSSGQFFTPEDDTNETVIEKSWENPCDQEEREAKRKECIDAGKQLDPKTCTCIEIPDDPSKTKIPKYETFPRDDRSLLNRLEQYNEIEQINPTLVQEDRFAPDPAYLDPRAKLASIEANVQEAIKNDPKNASFLMGKASELSDKVINEYENLNNKIYNNFATTAVDARNKEEEVNTEHLKTFFDESAMAEENYNVERQESKDAWVDAANQREENADEMYVRNFENPNFWFSPQAHEIRFYNEKGLDPTKAQNIDWNQLSANAPKDKNAAKLYWDHMRNKYGITTPANTKHLNTRTIENEETEVVKHGKEIDRIRRADLMRSKKKLRKWILGIK